MGKEALSYVLSLWYKTVEKDAITSLAKRNGKEKRKKVGGIFFEKLKKREKLWS